jgi:predicted nuclease of predicted toxin-antitoxin system
VSEPVRFYLDQHLSHALAAGLRSRGIDVLTASDVGRCGLADPDQLAFATAEGRVMVSFDPDYLALHAAGVSHAGIAWSPATKHSIGGLINALDLIQAVLTADEMTNHVEYL